MVQNLHTWGGLFLYFDARCKVLGEQDNKKKNKIHLQNSVSNIKNLF